MVQSLAKMLRRVLAAGQLVRPVRTLAGARFASSASTDAGKGSKEEPSAADIVKIERKDGIAIVRLFHCEVVCSLRSIYS